MLNIEEYLNSFFKGTKDPSLDAMKYFINEYNDFEKNMKFIHIAGTNGKGSCTEMISNILEKQGYKVGKFMSPHLIKYNERISINKKEITDKELENLIKELEPKIKEYNKNKGVKVTLFELETIMGLLYFYRNNVDFAILETGLGGLYDCTNIISHPLVSIITSIGMDHMQILGNTLPEIAYQKAGIVKKNSNTVFFEQSNEINNVFIDKCVKENNELHLISEKNIKNYKYDENYQYFDYNDFNNIKINLKGIKQVRNAAVCIETMKILNKLGYKVSNESIREGLETVIHKGRMEKIFENPTIIYDGAHNEPAIENLQTSVDMYYKGKKRRYIVSILERKDYDKMIKLLLQDKDASFIFTGGNDPKRYASASTLYETARKYKRDKTKIDKKELEEAIKFILEDEEDCANFVVGSFYVYGTVVEKLQKRLT